MTLETVRAGRLAQILLVGSAALCGWAFLLVTTGGFDLSFVTAHNPVRPLLAGCVALAAYVFVTRGSSAEPIVLVSARVAAIAAGLIAIVAGAVTYVYSAKVAGGSDSWGYLSEANLWLSGHLRFDHGFARDVPWPDALRTFTPLAYRPAQDWTIVPFVSPGLPALLAAAMMAGGSTAMFAVVPFSCVVLVLATYGIGARLASPLAGLVAAWFAATSPIVLYMSAGTMSDVPAAALVAAGFYFLLGSSNTAATMAGLMTGLGVAVRPNLALLAPAMALRFVGAGSLRRRTAWFIIGLVPGVLGLAAFNHVLNGSAVTSGYENLAVTFRFAHVVPNIANFIRWVVDTQTWLGFVGLAALAISARDLWPQLEHRRLLIVSGLVVSVLTLFYAFYTVFDTWMYLRFLIGAWPIALAGLGAVAAWLMNCRTRAAGAVAALAAVTLGLVHLQLAESHGVFTAWKDERRYVETGRLVARLTEPASVVLSMQHSGSLRYYGGRMTLRYDALDPAWADRAVDWLASRGVHAYLVADDWEMPNITRRFSGSRIAEAIQRPPRAIVGEAGAVFLYDLTTPADADATTERVTVGADTRAVDPLPAPTLALPRAERDVVK